MGLDVDARTTYSVNRLTLDEIGLSRDEEAVQRFEAFVQGQTPASTPWTPVTPYDFESRKAVEGKHPELMKAVFQPKQVLDVGCGPGHLVALLRGLGVNATGCDKTPQIGHPWFFTLDIGKRQRVQVLPQPDLVVYREVNEHLTVRQMREAVGNLCYLSSRWVYGTTRFHAKPTHILDVADRDDLDPTHISLVTRPFLSMLFALEGFRARPDMAAAMDWRGYGRTFVFERGA